MKQVYTSEYYQSPEAGDQTFKEKKHELLDCYSQVVGKFKKLGVNGVLVDVGCGRGEFLSVAREMGQRCEGVEPSQWAASAARSIGLSIREGDLVDLDIPLATYHAAYCAHVLEHVPNLHGFLEKLHSILAATSPIYIEVPLQFDGLLDLIDRIGGTTKAYSSYSIHHQYFFTPRALSLLLEQHGFRVLSLSTFLPCRRANRASSIRVRLLQAALCMADRAFRRGDVIAVWARRM